ncbi:MAG: hypothetical protein KJZ80_08730 [Hyphomicrobiaceae bacterium]|nr:hypothetical protein [Hyphomicrobiaceae bacterium]
MTVTTTTVSDATRIQAETRPGADLVVERESVTPAAPVSAPPKTAAARKSVNWYEGYRAGYFC